MCFAISAEALGFAALRALSDISSIFFLSPTMHFKSPYHERRNGKRYEIRNTCCFFMIHDIHLVFTVPKPESFNRQWRWRQTYWKSLQLQWLVCMSRDPPQLSLSHQLSLPARKHFWIDFPQINVAMVSANNNWKSNLEMKSREGSNECDILYWSFWYDKKREIQRKLEYLWSV